MKILLSTLWLVILNLPSSAVAEQTCDKVPHGWNRETSVNTDNLCADVLLKSDEDGTRKLRVFESAKLAFESDDAALCKNCGGVRGDPFQGIEWRGRTLSVSNWGGSRFTWDENWKIAKKHGQWKLIGWERGTTDTLSLSNWTESVNTLTRTAIAAYEPGETAGCEELAENPKNCINRKPKPKSLKCKIKLGLIDNTIGRIAKVRGKPFACGLKIP